MDRYETLSQALGALDKEGYTASFKVDGSKLKSLQTARAYGPTRVTIVNHFRFEGASDPDDMSVLYVVECNDGTKGTIVDAYGAYAELDDFIKSVPTHEGHPGQ